MSTMINNAARMPIEVGTHLAKFPVMVNDLSGDELEQLSKLLLRAGQRSALEMVVASDGIAQSMKNVINRVLNAHRRALH
jgi:hypothetical protein